MTHPDLNTLIDQAVDADPWDAPIPLTATPNLPTFPVDAFPPWLAAMVRETAASTETPPDMAGMLALAVLATCAQRRFRVHVAGDWEESLSLFCVTAMPPGNRKSAVFGALIDPIREYEAQELERTATAIQIARSDRSILESRLKAAQSDAAKAKTNEDADQQRTVARELAQELANTPEPVAPQFLADDATPEALATLIAEQGGRMAVLSDEGTIFEIAAGRYSENTPRLEVFLQAQAGGDLRINRRGRVERVQRAALTLGVTVQPDVIHGLARAGAFRGRGFIGRCLFSLPISRLGYRTHDGTPITNETRRAYRAAVLGLLAIPPAMPKDAAYTLRCHPRAVALLKGLQHALEPQLRPDGIFAHMTDWAGKLAGTVVRIAGLLHLAAHTDSAPWETPICADSMDAAIQIGRYLAVHARAAIEQMGADLDVEIARRCLAWILQHGEPTFTRKTLFDAVRGTVKTVEKLEGPLKHLIESNYIRPLPEAKRPGRPSQRYEVNPQALVPPAIGSFADSADNAESITIPETAEYAPAVEPMNGHRSGAIEGFANIADSAEPEEVWI